MRILSPPVVFCKYISICDRIQYILNVFFSKNAGQGSSLPGRYNQSQSPKFRVQRVCNHLDFASISFNKKLDFKPFSGLYTYNFPLHTQEVSGSSPFTPTRKPRMNARFFGVHAGITFFANSVVCYACAIISRYALLASCRASMLGCV